MKVLAIQECQKVSIGGEKTIVGDIDIDEERFSIECKDELQMSIDVQAYPPFVIPFNNWYIDEEKELLVLDENIAALMLKAVETMKGRL